MRATIINSNVISGYLSIRAEGSTDPMELRRRLTAEFAAGDRVVILAAAQDRHTGDNAHNCCKHDPAENCCDNHPANPDADRDARFVAAYLDIVSRHTGCERSGCFMAEELGDKYREFFGCEPGEPERCGALIADIGGALTPAECPNARPCAAHPSEPVKEP